MQWPLWELLSPQAQVALSRTCRELRTCFHADKTRLSAWLKAGDLGAADHVAA